MKFEISKIATYAGHKDSIYDLDQGTNPHTFLSASGDGYVVEWLNPETGKPLVKVNHPIYAIHKNNQILWLGENSKGLHAIDIAAKTELKFLALDKVSVFDIQNYQELTFVVSSMGYIHIIKDFQFIHHISASNKSARCIAIQAQRGEFAVGFSDHSIRIYDLNTFELKHTINGHTNSVFTLCYFENYLLSSGRDAHIKVWDAQLNYLQATDVPAHNYAINHILPLEGTSLLASCSMDKSIKIWDIHTLNLLKVIDKGKFISHGTSINKLWWNSIQKRLYSGSDDRTISEWKLF